MPHLTAQREQLLERLRSYGSCAVAFSGGVDSAVVAKAARLALDDRAIAVTAVSPSLPEGELEQARELAALIGIRHETVSTDEFDEPDYVRNAPDRCYHCKHELYTQLAELAGQLGLACVASGANADDLGDYRPGLTAAAEQGVQSPLAECHITKREVRELAAHWKLPVADKPAAPCLASRVAYGQEVTPERLAMIDRAEQYLRAQGLPQVRVRYHGGDLARVEVPADAIARLCQPATRTALAQELKSLGFRFVTLDLEGFRSGSLNDLVPLDLRSGS